MTKAAATMIRTTGGEERTQADFVSLLGELNRLLKTLSLYGATPAQRQAQNERTLLAWQADLDRHGPLTLALDDGCFEADGLNLPVELGHLQGLAAALTDHEIDHLNFAAPLRRAAFGALGELLAGEASPEASLDPTARSWSLETDGIEVLLLAQPTPADRPEPHSLEAAPLPAAEKPTVEEQPLPIQAGSQAAEPLIAWLLQLDECEEDDAYAEILAAIKPATLKLSRDGFAEDAYRVCLVLADHAVGEGGRSGAQAQCAQDTLLSVATEGALPDLIARACDGSGAKGVRAACVLLQLGDAAAIAIFDALSKETDSSRKAQLNGLMIALGERGRSVLESNMKRPGGSWARLAVRISGEIQSTAFVPALAAVLSGNDLSLRREAAMALLTIGGPIAINPLIVALSSPLEKLSEVAAFCLGELRDPRATAPLMRALESHTTSGRLDTARELVRALGRIGAAEAVPRLKTILGERGLTKRRARRDLKLAAVAALARIPGREAKIVLSEAAKDAEAPIREKAKQSLAQPPLAEAAQ